MDVVDKGLETIRIQEELADLWGAEYPAQVSISIHCATIEEYKAFNVVEHRRNGTSWKCIGNGAAITFFRPS